MRPFATVLYSISCGWITIELATLSNWTFCSGVIEWLLTLYNKTFCSGVIARFLTLYNWTFCSGVIAWLLTLYNWTFCSGVTARFLTLYNWTFCSGVIGAFVTLVSPLFHGRIPTGDFPLYNRTFCSGITTSSGTLCNWTFCSEVIEILPTPSLKAPLDWALQAFTMFDRSCGSTHLDRQPQRNLTSSEITERVSIWHNNTHSAVISLVFCCAFIAIALIQICRSLGIVDPLFVPALLNWFHSEANSFHFNFNSFTLYKLAFCSGVAKIFTLYNRAFCSGVSITRCIETFCRGVTITITLCNWAFCSGVIFGLATPYNWTFCGGVTAIFTLYNWVFCGGAHRRATSLNNQIFCGGVISILTLCNWTFCSEVDNHKLSKLCCAAIVNLVLTVCRSRCHTGFNWILTFCFCEGQRRKLGLIFPWLDICSVVITSLGNTS